VICLRCGYCCQQYIVGIVRDPDLGPVEGNLMVVNERGPGDGPCPHLRGDEPGSFSCAVHDRPWYNETPCQEYGQIESRPDTPCRIGSYIMEKRGRCS
jgi:hypothetical protein